MNSTMRICPDLSAERPLSAAEFHSLTPAERPWSLPGEVWDEIHQHLGLRGQGTILISIDDGLDASHEALQGV